MKKLLSLFFLFAVLANKGFASSEIENITHTANLTLTYIEQWDVPSGLFKWYRGAVELDSGDKFEILPTYFSPHCFLFKGKAIEFYQIEDLIYILRDPISGKQIQATPFQDISPLSHNYGRSQYYAD